MPIRCGGNGNCDGTGGFADAADGYPGLYGEDRGYWLPELLEHMASHGVVTVCPYLSGMPDAGWGMRRPFGNITTTITTVNDSRLNPPSLFFSSLSPDQCLDC